MTYSKKTKTAVSFVTNRYPAKKQHGYLADRLTDQLPACSCLFFFPSGLEKLTYWHWESTVHDHTWSFISTARPDYTHTLSADYTLHLISEPYHRIDYWQDMFHSILLIWSGLAELTTGAPPFNLFFLSIKEKHFCYLPTSCQMMHNEPFLLLCTWFTCMSKPKPIPSSPLFIESKRNGQI